MSDSENSEVDDGEVDGDIWTEDMETDDKTQSPLSESNSSPPSQNIHVSNDYMELDETVVLDEKKALLEEFERKRRARLITVPTDDSEVKNILRLNCEPICLFGEGPADRRNRLKDFLSRKDDDEVQFQQDDGLSVKKTDEELKEETWYHRGPMALKEARMYLATYSIPRARARLKKERKEKELTPELTRKAKKQDIQNKIRSYSLLGSQNADNRPISACSFSPSGAMLATASWSGMSKVWQVSDCTEKLLLDGHSSYVDSICWHPDATVSSDPAALSLISSGRDGTVNLWNLNSSKPMDTLPKIEGSRVSKVQFHPSGRYIGMAVHDNTWRLWDLQAKEEILYQEGHSRAVHCLKFQNDGSLVATGGMDCYGRLWDLRTGRCIMFLSGHDGSVLDMSWSPDGYHLASGSEDNSAKIWDVRQRACLYTIPAHSSIISGVTYDPIGGQYLATCSYDGTVKLWCHGSFQPLKSLEGHGQKVLGVDISLTNDLIVSCSFDRTFKLWGPETLNFL